MIILSCNDIQKSFGTDVILDNITFHIKKGERVGLVGLNGAGKSTLMKIISGQLSYDRGNIYISKSTTIGYLEQREEFSKATVYHEALSVFQHLITIEEQLRKLEKQISQLSDKKDSAQLAAAMDHYSTLTEEFESKDGYSYNSKVRGVLKGLGFSDDDFNLQVENLSGGEKTRLSLAKLLLSNPEIIMLDEPTNHLDIEAVEWLEGFLRDYKGTVIIISHDRFFLDQLVNAVLEIENHTVTSYNGNYSAYVEKKRLAKEQQLRAYENQQKEIEEQKDIIRRLRQHGTEKLMNRAKSREKQLDKLELINPPVENNRRAGIQFSIKFKSGDDVLKVEGLGKAFDSNPLFSNVNFQIYRGEKVALIGPNGIGKSTILRLIMNELTASEGLIKLGHHVKIGYYHQEQGDLNPANTVLDEIWNQHRLKTEAEVRGLLGRFLFHGEDVFKTVSSLSGGERGRLSLLKLMLSEANFLLLDEPTNHLDIQAKEVLEEAIINYEGTVLVISHDRYFINKISTKIIELLSNGTEEFLGDYDYYLFKKRQKHQDASVDIIEDKTKTQVKEERKKEKELKKRLKAEKDHLSKIEEEIQALEKTLEELELLMCEEEIYSNPTKSKDTSRLIADVKEKLECMYQEWENALNNIS